MKHGNFIWYELVTTDPAAAADFYGKVMGWEADPEAGKTLGAGDYTVVQVPGFPMGVAGMMQLTQQMADNGGRPAWMGYVAVDDVEATIAAFEASGGKAHMGPADIPNVGRIAVVADPQGAIICLLKPLAMDGPMPPAPAENAPGTFGWRELYADNGDTVFDFYAGTFGWQKDRAVDMGEMGVYQLFKLDGPALGGMMTKMPQMPMPFWNYYVNVEDIEAAIARVNEAGGTVINGPHEVPGGAMIVQALDPQGAMFSMTAPPKG
ncbi:VOC family protein [Rhizobium halophytocola]|uniref:Enzyme related to lactoylglutathione lyase n=1 Tax=Rhizobium halophytocola TaxID=735519 RepID=A0ABS4DWZ4_9HYPH|nr:putative enzyme related to lactoylglutathione lyase [Rhizobium halophytocola]